MAIAGRASYGILGANGMIAYRTVTPREQVMGIQGKARSSGAYHEHCRRVMDLKMGS
jgi:hypothetical protein